MSLKYVDLVRIPGVVAVTLSQLFARLPIAMLSLAILLQVQAQSGSYALAGAVVAGMCVGEAISMPLTARLSGHFGIVRTLLTSACVNAAAILLLAFAHPRALFTVALGLLIGVSMPPLMPVVRALYPQLVPGDAVPLLFALDTSAQELIFILGPVATTMLAAAVSPTLPLAVCALITATGTSAFLLSIRTRRVTTARGSASFGSVLVERSVILAVLASLLLVGSFSALEVGIVADLGPGQLTSGVAIAVGSLGSLVGGVMFGHRRIGTPGLVSLMATITLGTALSGVFDHLALQFAALFAAGFGFAPALSTLYLAVSENVEDHATSEAFGWVNTGMLIGAAMGTAAGGALSDSFGAAGAFLTAVVLALLGTLAPFVVKVPRPPTTHAG